MPERHAWSIGAVEERGGYHAVGPAACPRPPWRGFAPAAPCYLAITRCVLDQKEVRTRVREPAGRDTLGRCRLPPTHQPTGAVEIPKLPGGANYTTNACRAAVPAPNTAELGLGGASFPPGTHLPGSPHLPDQLDPLRQGGNGATTSIFTNCTI